MSQRNELKRRGEKKSSTQNHRIVNLRVIGSVVMAIIDNARFHASLAVQNLCLHQNRSESAYIFADCYSHLCRIACERIYQKKCCIWFRHLCTLRCHSNRTLVSNLLFDWLIQINILVDFAENFKYFDDNMANRHSQSVTYYSLLFFFSRSPLHTSFEWQDNLV